MHECVNSLHEHSGTKFQDQTSLRYTPVIFGSEIVRFGVTRACERPINDRSVAVIILAPLWRKLFRRFSEDGIDFQPLHLLVLSLLCTI